MWFLSYSYFYDFLITEITPLHVQKWQLFLSKKGYAPSYIRIVQGLFSLAMDRSVVLGLVESNLSKIVGNVKKTKTKIDFWTKEEFEKVLSFFYKEDYFNYSNTSLKL